MAETAKDIANRLSFAEGLVIVDGWLTRGRVVGFVLHKLVILSPSYGESLDDFQNYWSEQITWTTSYDKIMTRAIFGDRLFICDPWDFTKKDFTAHHPHLCPRCGSAALILAVTCECSNTSCPNFVSF